MEATLQDTIRTRETSKFSNTSFLRDCGRFKFLLSYYTPAAVFDSKTGKMYQTSLPWSHTTKCHIGKFRREFSPTDIQLLEQEDLEARVYRFFTKRAMKAARKKRAGQVMVGIPVKTVQL